MRLSRRARASDREADGIDGSRRVALAIAIVYCGVTFTLVVAFAVGTAGDFTLASFLHWIGLLSSGVAASFVLGPGIWLATLRLRATLLELVQGAGAGLVMIAVGLAYVGLLPGGEAPEAGEPMAGVWVLLEIVILAPLVEEWLCRGVLWSACRRGLSIPQTILLTALLFALLHGLGGGYVFELPHRFAGGLVLGILRARTRSLGPCILAHGVNNLVAVALG